MTGLGGTQLYTSQLADALSKSNNEIILLLGNYLYDKKYYSESNIKIIQIDSERSYITMILKMMNPLMYYRVFKIIDFEKPDIIHILVEDLLVGILSCLLKVRGYKLVLTEHDPSLHVGEKCIEKIDQRLTKSLIRKRVNAIIVHGNHLKNILIRRGIKDNKIWAIPHGDYSFYTKWDGNIEIEKKSILFFGRIIDYKGLEYLITAENKIASIIPNIKIIIAGNGDFSKYENLIKNKGHFEIHNRYILDEEIASFFQRASVIVLPYTDGSQSGIIPIAYAFKRPVVVTNVGSIPEVVDNGITGFIVPPKDADALAEAIIKILNDDNLRDNMGENAYRKMKAELSWDAVAEKTIEVYTKVIGE